MVVLLVADNGRRVRAEVEAENFERVWWVVGCRCYSEIIVGGKNNGVRSEAGLAVNTDIETGGRGFDG